MRRLARTLLWSVVAALVVMTARELAYAVEPSPLSQQLSRAAGGPSAPLVALSAFAAAAAVAVTICALAALAVRERAMLLHRPPPSFALGRALAAAALLSVVTCVAGGLLEAYIHWRAGLGWHGLHCLVGPEHRNLIPLEIALSLVATAIVGSAAHVAAWARQTFARLAAELPSPLRTRLPQSASAVELHVRLDVAAAPARAPPAGV